MRKLASIQQITGMYPIQGKDFIALAQVEGWHVIVRKEDYKVGDKCVFCEIDSVLPDKPQFEFMRKNDFRVKTMKMAGVVSQGLCFPLSILPVGQFYNIGDDVTELMGIKQYEPTMDIEKNNLQSSYNNKYPKFLMRFKWFRKLVSKTKNQKNGWPEFVSKTDETRIQNAPFYLELDDKWVLTEKVDGTSGTFALKRIRHKFKKDTFEFIVCSRNIRLYNDDNSIYWKVANKYHIENVLKYLIRNNDWIAIQGECISPSVQGNVYNVNTEKFYAFNLIDSSHGRYGSTVAKELLEDFDMPFVPIIASNVTLPETVDEMLEMATDTSQLYNTLREGLVCRSMDGRHSFKAVSNEYLLKHNN